MPKRSKDSRDAFKVAHNVFDEFTNRTLYKLITEGTFDGMEGPLSIGKESNVFTGWRGDTRIVVKIYRLESCDFNRMYDYIKGDPRYTRVTKKRRQVIFAWTQREYRNLMKAREANVVVPLPLAFMNNVLILEWVGTGQATAPKLKDKVPKDPEAFFKEVVANMKRLHAAKLVHGDLSSFNILNRDEQPVFIDFSQATPFDNARAREFLERDVKNVCTFFQKQGVDAREEDVLKEILGK